MANGRQVAELNFQSFLIWRESKSIEEFRKLENRGVLNRKNIAIECGFATSVLRQNPRVKAELQNLEDRLRNQGVLPKHSDRSVRMENVVELRSQRTSTHDSDQLRRLENDNVMLKQENEELKRQLDRYGLLSQALFATGRLPR